MVAAKTSRKRRSRAESSAPSVSKAESSARRRRGTCADLLGLHILCGILDEVQDYQLRIQQNRTCITSYAPYQLRLEIYWVNTMTSLEELKSILARVGTSCPSTRHD
jgi:hypothetical protein